MAPKYALCASRNTGNVSASDGVDGWSSVEGTAAGYPVARAAFFSLAASTRHQMKVISPMKICGK